MTQRLLHTLAALLLLAPLPALAAEAVGTVVMLTGKATALGTDGTVRKLAKNDAVFSGDLVNSGTRSYVNLKFTDGAFFLLRPETRFQIEQYDYAVASAAAPAAAKPAATAIPVMPTKSAASASAAPVAQAAAPTAGNSAPLVTGTQRQGATGNSRAFFRLVKGGFRSVSGLIGKLNRDDYRVTTPVATIGIRGTSYSARLCDATSCEDRDEINRLAGSAGKPLNSNETVLITTVDDGGIELQSSQSSSRQDACRATANGEKVNIAAASTCGALFTSGSGDIIIVPTMPSVENNERSLNPESCT